MYKPLSIFLAHRYSRARQVGGFAAFISASSTLGIALGVMVLIVVLSAMNGFEKALADKLLSIVPHGEIIAVHDPVENWQPVVDKVAKQPGVQAAAPLIKITGMLQYKTALKSLEVRGVDAKQELTVSSIDQYISAGQWSNLNDQHDLPQIIIGHGIAQKLGVSLGDKVQLLVPPKLDSNQLVRKFPAPKKHNLRVAGIFKFSSVVDEGLAYINLTDAQKIKEYSSDSIDGVRFMTQDIFQAPQIAHNVAYSFTDHYFYIYDWTFSQGHLFKDIQLVRMIMTLVMILVIAVASFNIVSTLIMVVNEKRSDIAILKTMGASSPSIMLTFVLQGMVNGVVGCALGALTGVLLAENLTLVMQSIEQLFNTQFLSGDVYFIDYLPSELIASDVYTTLIIAMVLTVLATLYPSWRATKIDPAVVLGQT